MNLWALVLPVTVAAIFTVVALIERHQTPRRNPRRRDAGAARTAAAGRPLRATDNTKENS